MRNDEMSISSIGSTTTAGSRRSKSKRNQKRDHIQGIKKKAKKVYLLSLNHIHSLNISHLLSLNHIPSLNIISFIIIKSHPFYTEKKGFYTICYS